MTGVLDLVPALYAAAQIENDPLFKKCKMLVRVCCVS